jgi:putative hydrolase of the HAD superfamily
MFMNLQYIKIIAFDADDTLWVNEPYYRNCENQFALLMQNYGDADDLKQKLFEVEMNNLSSYGYGAKSFGLSMIEAAMAISGGRINIGVISQIIDLAKGLIHSPLELLPGVKVVLQSLSGKYRLVLATKGDLLDQERKLLKSGLDACFHHIEIMSDKQTKNYLRLLNHLDCAPNEFLMIGNSVKSDIIPVLEIGAQALYVPFHTTWQHEIISQDLLSRYQITELNAITEVLNFGL